MYSWFWQHIIHYQYSVNTVLLYDILLYYVLKSQYYHLMWLSKRNKLDLKNQMRTGKLSNNTVLSYVATTTNGK